MSLNTNIDQGLSGTERDRDQSKGCPAVTPERTQSAHPVQAREWPHAPFPPDVNGLPTSAPALLFSGLLDQND